MLNVLCNIVVDCRWQGEVEETVSLNSSRQRQDVCVEFGEGTLITIFPTDIRVPAEEGRQPLCFRISRLDQSGNMHGLDSITFIHYAPAHLP